MIKVWRVLGENKLTQVNPIKNKKPKKQDSRLKNLKLKPCYLK
ncbi:hypothetical protein [Sutcliffiella rhizosphaerae]|uniref:Uncharacterized protein n=1 Tax=Sutcliffiella rhizosphaerae TaxID=2880967 RepID=A0ABM8YSK0_9BACI|nr:hypothetical protein [Sutcliffiella rhizosphaerae]CAG9622823.1 hypothetical protein BACCIP111883_03614 [Sutcliffiella rhizosphaerae]